MTNAWTEYFSLLEEIGKRLDELTGLQQEKTQAVRQDDLLGVNACMKREQALSLALRSVERKRENLLNTLGFSGTSLSALAGLCPPELRIQARAASERLRSRYELYQSAAEVARNTLECNLHQIEKLIEKHWGSEYLADPEAGHFPGGPVSGGGGAPALKGGMSGGRGTFTDFRA